MSDQIQLPAVPAPEWGNIPEILATRQQWLLWKFEPPKKEGAKPTKVPYYVQGGRRTGGQGDDRDRMRLATLDVARRAYERGGWSGVGFAFLPNDGLIGIDIDGAIDPDSGEVSDLCSSIIAACKSYTEWSVSGKGVHIIVEGHTTTNKSNDIGLEVFCGSQYFIFSGRAWGGEPVPIVAIEESVVKRLHVTIDEAKDKRKSAPRPGTQPTHQQETLSELRARVESALQMVSPELGYTDWLSIGWALHDAFGDFAFGLWDSWSAGSAKYPGASALQSHWKSFRPATTSPDDAVGVIFKRAIEAGWKPPKQAKPQKPPRAKLPASAESGSSVDAGDPPAADDPMDDADGNVLDALIKNRGKPVDCRENVLYCFRHDPTLQGLVQHNNFTEIHERSRVTPWGSPAGEWDEEDDMMLGEYLASRYRLLLRATGTLRAGVLMAAREHKFNPIIDLIKSEVWDGTNRLEHWLTDVYEIEERPYTQLIGKCFIMGMVMRAMRPGCKFDYMLILKGEQGLTKSGSFRALAEPWFTDNAIRVGDKDSLMAMQLVWIAESAELESLNKSETTAIKQFLSAQDDMFRPPYGAQIKKRPRHTVMAGTTNADTFLKDATGDRRFWPLEVKTVNLDVLRAQRLQLFAEALHRLKQKEQYWPSREEEKTLIFPEQERFKSTDPWEDYLADYVSATVNHRTDDPSDPIPLKRDFFSTRELFDHALNIKADRIDGNRQMETRIGNCMKALGFEKFRESKGARKRGYMRLRKEQITASPTGAAGDSAGEDDDLPI